MDEDIIVSRLKQNIPVQAEPSAPAAPSTLVDEQSSIVENAVSELGLLKLGSELGFSVVPTSPETVQQLKFVYEQMVEVSPNTSYEKVLDTVNNYLLHLGLKYSPDRFMKLYLWLKLNQERMAIDKEMANVRQPAT